MSDIDSGLAQMFAHYAAGPDSPPRSARERQREQTMARGRAMARKVIAGATMQEVGDEYGLTRERVRQLIIKVGLYEDVQAHLVANRERRTKARATARAEHREQRREEIRRGEWVNDWTKPVWSFDDCVDAVRAWLDAGGSGSVTDWNHEHQLPSSATIIKRGGWNAAIAAAGGTPSRRHHTHRSDRARAIELVLGLGLFLASNRPKYAYDDYDIWTREMGLRSAQSVRNRFGTWNKAKRAALAYTQGMTIAEIEDALVEEMAERERKVG